MSIPVDVVGRTVSFRPSPNSDVLYGEVINVGFQWPYPKDKNGLRYLKRQISVMLPDGRVLNMSAAPEDIKKYRIVAENEKQETW